LGFAVKLHGDCPFLGRPALEAQRLAPLPRLLAVFTIEDPAVVLLGRETILRNGVPVGHLTSGGFGYTVGANIGLGYVRNESGVTRDFVLAGDYRLEVASETVRTHVSLEPPYDPRGNRIRI
jgi:4-methylaminobutanoate oxidase (formaldehyde-forming)